MFQEQKKIIPLADKETYEGEYTTWTYIHTNLWAWLWAGNPVRIDNHGTYYVYDTVGAVLYIRDRNNTVYDVAGWDVVAGVNLAARFSSINNKYVIATQLAVSPTFRIYRRGILYFNRNTSLDIATVVSIWAIWMSPNGKYILAFTNGAVGRRVMLYEGT